MLKRIYWFWEMFIISQAKLGTKNHYIKVIQQNAIILLIYPLFMNMSHFNWIKYYTSLKYYYTACYNQCDIVSFTRHQKKLLWWGLCSIKK